MTNIYFKKISDLFRIIGGAFNRFYWDDCFSRAASLSYTTLFALVPATYLMANILSLIGLEPEQATVLIDKVVSELFPSGGSDLEVDNLKVEILSYLESFRNNVQSLNAISIGVLIFTSISLINTIESALNVIWKSVSNLSLMAKITNFWSILTLGPILLGLSFYLPTTVSGVDFSVLPPWVFSVVVPVFVLWLGLLILYYKLPSAKVDLVDAAFGAFVAAILFEFVKWGFKAFVIGAGTYSKVYAGLAAIPLFLFWMYMAWCVVLLGAEVVFLSGSFKIINRLQSYETDLGEIGAILGVKILHCLAQRFTSGLPGYAEGDIAIETGTNPVLVQSCLEVLDSKGLIITSDSVPHLRTLAHSPDKITIEKVYRSFLSKSFEKESTKKSQDLAMKSFSMSFLVLFSGVARKTFSQSKNGEKTLADIVKNWTIKDLVLSSDNEEN